MFLNAKSAAPAVRHARLRTAIMSWQVTRTGFLEIIGAYIAPP